MCSGEGPRAFDSGNHGYHNDTLGTGVVALELPLGCRGAVVTVSAGCFIGLRTEATAAVADDANYGSIGPAAPHRITRKDFTETHLHLAALTGTASVQVYFF